MKLILIENGSDYQRANYFSDNPVKNFLHIFPLRAIVSAIPKKKYHRILEIGCADGILLPTLSPHCEELYAIDIVSKFFKYIRRYNLPNLFLSKGDAQKMKYPSNFFDLIFCLETLEHVPHPELAVKEIKRVMKKGGLGVISVPIELGPALLLKQIGRILLGYGLSYEGGYPLPELINAVLFKKPNTEYHREHLGHRGFDYRRIIRLLHENRLSIVKLWYLPINIFGENLSYRVVIFFTK